MAAGYSGTPLAVKLGIKAGAVVRLIGAPRGFEATLDGMPEGVRVRRSGGAAGSADVAVFFPADGAALRRGFRGAAGAITEDGGLWVAWPKKSSGVKTDLSDGVVREVGLAHGLVDNKVCAISETLSGLRFVVRLKDRGGGERRARQ